MKNLRRVIGVRRMSKTRNKDMRQRLGIKSVKDSLEDKKLMWFCSFVRMGEETQVKNI